MSARLQELIKYHQKREQACVKEIDHCTTMLAKNRHFNEADCKDCLKVWTEERTMARDTVSYLQTLERKLK